MQHDIKYSIRPFDKKECLKLNLTNPFYDIQPRIIDLNKSLFTVPVDEYVTKQIALINLSNEDMKYTFHNVMNDVFNIVADALTNDVFAHPLGP